MRRSHLPIVRVLAGLLFLTACSEQTSVNPPLDVAASGSQYNASQRTLKLKVKESVALTVNSTQIKNPKSVKWSSTNPSRASVTSSGVVTGIEDGDVLIVASSGNLRDTTWVTVFDDAPAPGAHSLDVTPSSVVLDWLGAKSKLSGVVRDGSGNVVASELTWRSLNSSVAEVDGMGNVTAKTVGTALIAVSAVCCNAVDTVGVRVYQRIDAVAVQSVVTSVQSGDSLQVAAVAKDQGGTVVPNTGFVWTTSNPAVATVSPTGVVKAVAAGSVFIRAQAGDQQDSVTLSIVAPPPPPPTVVPPTGANEIPLTLHRLDGGTGTVRVSSGIMLTPGQLHASNVGKVAVFVNGAEVSAYVEALHGRHRDGSVISVLIQFDADPSRHSATLHLNGAPTRSRLAKRVIDFRPGSTTSNVQSSGYPAAIAVPPVAQSVAAFAVFGPTVSVDEARARGGEFMAYEDDFVQWSKAKWDGYTTFTLSSNYYDRGLHHLAWFARSGNPEFLRRGASYTFNYRYHYYEANNYGVAGPHRWFPEGLAAHYWLTGDEESRNAVRAQGTVAFRGGAASWWLKWAHNEHAGELRPIARTIQMILWMHRLGYTDADYEGALRQTVDRLLTIEQYNTNPSHYRYGAWSFWKATVGDGTEYVSNFMNAMLVSVLIDIYEHVHADPRIPGMVQRNLDYLRRTQWLTDHSSPSFNYYDVSVPGSGGPGATVDLNGFYVHIFAWYANRFGGTEYASIASQTFRTLSRNPKDGKNGPWLSGDKQFNETYAKAWQLLGYPY